MPDDNTRDDAERLEPCPYCDVTEHLSVAGDDSFGTASAFVACALCDCRGPHIVAVTGEESLSVRESAIAEWNRRVNRDASLRDAREKLADVTMRANIEIARLRDRSTAKDDVVAAARKLMNCKGGFYSDIEGIAAARRELREALARLAAVPDPLGWRLIDDAARDGKEWLLWSHLNQSAAVCFWDAEKPHVYKWQTADGAGYHQERFTHYRSIPAPPAAPREEGEG